MTNLDDNRLVKTFAEFRGAARKALVPFITAGYPDLETTEALLRDFQGRGVRVCELGIPFSDPVADGPVIQNSYTLALEAGVTTEKIFKMVRRFRATSRDREGAGNRPADSASRDREGAGNRPADSASRDREGAGNRPADSASRDREGAGNRPADSASRDREGAGSTGAELALVAMVSYSIVFRHGVEQYLKDAREAGFDGVIIPDLPLDETALFEPLAASHGLANVMLIAPTTPLPRRLEIARHSRGFIYYISVAGITGERTEVPDGTIAAVAELRKHTETPVCVGFGISDARMVEAVCKTADGAIVGSAIVHRINDAAAKKLPRETLVKQVGDFITELLKPLS